MQKGFIIQIIFVETTAPVSIAVSMVVQKVLHRFIEHLMQNRMVFTPG